MRGVYRRGEMSDVARAIGVPCMSAKAVNMRAADSPRKYHSGALKCPRALAWASTRGKALKRVDIHRRG